MRAHVSVEAEVRVSSTIAPEVAAYPVGQGKTGLYGIDVAQAMSLRLSAPRGGFIIEAQSPETQWVWRSKSQSVNELAAWRFIITPNRRGSNSLRLTFSCKEIGPNGLLADSALPDRMLDIVVSTNLVEDPHSSSRLGHHTHRWCCSGSLLLNLRCNLLVGSTDRPSSLEHLQLDY